MKLLVSILIPAYNAEPWIAQAIQSALRQTWPEKEIIVVDDGSTDKTLSVAEKFSGEGVKIVSQKNRGASAARNQAFSLCRGDFIQWLDADDLLAPDKISRQMEVIESCGNKRILFSSEWGRFHFRLSRAEFIPTALWDNLPPVEWLFYKLRDNVFMQPGTWLVSRELTEAAGPWDERLSLDDDGEYFCRVLLKSDGVKFIRGAKMFYRATGPASLSQMDFSDKKQESAWLSLQLHVKYLLSLEDSPRTRLAGVTFLQNWLPWFQRPDIAAAIKQLGANLGGSVELQPTSLRWKYAWMEKIFGRQTAERAQIKLPEFKHSLIRLWDKAMFQFEKTAGA